MADNVAITAGSGTSIAADDVSSVYYQRVKLDGGGDGASTPILAGGGVEASAIRVTIATDSTGVVSVDDNGSTLSVDDGGGVITVDGTVAVSAISAALPAGTNAIGKLAANSGVDIGDVDVTSISAGENHLGEVGGGGTLLEVTLSLDTSAYGDGDVHADTQSVASAFRVAAGRAILQSVVVLDEDDVGQTLDIIFLDSNNSLGTENAAPSISDANARTILGRVRIDSTEYIDLGGMKMASKSGIGLFLKGASASTTLYVGTIIRGAGTYSASGVRLRLGLLWD